MGLLRLLLTDITTILQTNFVPGNMFQSSNCNIEPSCIVVVVKTVTSDETFAWLARPRQFQNARFQDVHYFL